MTTSVSITATPTSTSTRAPGCCSGQAKGEALAGYSINTRRAGGWVLGLAPERSRERGRERERAGKRARPAGRLVAIRSATGWSRRARGYVDAETQRRTPMRSAWRSARAERRFAGSRRAHANSARACRLGPTCIASGERLNLVGSRSPASMWEWVSAIVATSHSFAPPAVLCDSQRAKLRWQNERHRRCHHRQACKFSQILTLAVAGRQITSEPLNDRPSECLLTELAAGKLSQLGHPQSASLRFPTQRQREVPERSLLSLAHRIRTNKIGKHVARQGGRKANHGINSAWHLDSN